MKSTRAFLLAAAFSASLIALSSAAAAAPAKLWADVAADQIPLVGPRLTTPLRARTVTLDTTALRSALAQAHGRAATTTAPQILLPLPQGGELAFSVSETQVMAPALAAKYPEIRTYQGRALSNPAINGRLQMDPRGFRAMINTPEGTWYIDSFSRGDTRNYQSYYAKDLPAKARPGDQVAPRLAPLLPSKRSSASGIALPGSAERGVSIAGNLRTYRLALAANFEYASFHDPIVVPSNPTPRIAVVLAELVNVANRVSGVYERELGVRLQLVAQNDVLICTLPGTCPYVDADGTSMLAVNTSFIDLKLTDVAGLGTSKYDIGHVASTGGGGVAFLGVVCDQLMKGGGVTGLSTPVGDDYYIDYVAHEMGHQFGGNHTFNGNTGSCSGNGEPTAAYEPGSGITIMAYAGICGAQNIAAHSIDTFHARSFDEIVAFTRDPAAGASCGVASTSSNRPPVAIPPAGGFVIPKGTPFELTGRSSDPDGDVVRYQWEEFDLGAAGAPNAAATVTTSTPPLFRPFAPTLNPTRVFPRIEDVVSGVQVIGEILPQVSRVMNFRLTVRDNYRVPGPGAPDTTESFEAGGVASDDLRFNVTAAAGPFLVTFPNATGLSFNGTSSQTVTWNVANTAVAPVSCPNVDIFLSTDGGLTYPIPLITGVANDGSQAVTLPNLASSTARVKVKCANSVFFDISNNNFTLVKVNIAPTAALKVVGPATGVNSQLFSLDAGGAGGSSDPEGGALMYAFDLDGNGSFEPYSSASTATATLVCNASSGRGPCRFSPSVKVKDPGGLESPVFTLVNGLLVTRYESITGRVLSSTANNRTIASSEAPAGVYEFDGKICNNTATTPPEVFSTLTATVTTITNGNTLLNRTRGGPGAGAELDYPAGAFAKAQCQVQKFRIGLQNRNRFTFLVNLGSVVEQ